MNSVLETPVALKREMRQPPAVLKKKRRVTFSFNQNRYPVTNLSAVFNSLRDEEEMEYTIKVKQTMENIMEEIRTLGKELNIDWIEMFKNL